MQNWQIKKISTRLFKLEDPNKLKEVLEILQISIFSNDCIVGGNRVNETTSKFD